MPLLAFIYKYLHYQMILAMISSIYSQIISNYFILVRVKVNPDPDVGVRLEYILDRTSDITVHKVHSFIARDNLDTALEKIETTAKFISFSGFTNCTYVFEEHEHFCIPNYKID